MESIHDFIIKEAMKIALEDEAVVGALRMLAEDEKPEKDRNFTGKQPVQYPLGLTLEIIKVSVLGGILYCKLFNY